MALTLESKHIITIGMFDQKEHIQVIPKQVFIDTVNQDINEYDLCATVLTEGIWGVYRHKDGSTVTEPSIRIEICGYEYETIKPMLRHLRKIFNQESVLYEKETHLIELLFEDDLEDEEEA